MTNCNYQLTEWVDRAEDIDFAMRQLEKYDDRAWVIRRNYKRQTALFVDFEPRPYVEIHSCRK